MGGLTVLLCTVIETHNTPLLSIMVATQTKYGNLLSAASSFIPTLKLLSGGGTTACVAVAEEEEEEEGAEGWMGFCPSPPGAV